MSTTQPQGRLRRAVYAIIEANPGFTSTEVVNVLPEQASSVGGTLSHLHRDGYLSRQRKGHHFHYFIAGEAPAALPEDAEALRAAEDRVAALTAEVAALTAELADVKHEAGEEGGTLIMRIWELTEWRARAIEKYPDLEPTDPLVLRARQIAEETVQGRASRAKIESIRSGRYDSLPIVQAALAALRSVQPCTA